MENVYNIIIWGLGKRSNSVIESIRFDKCNILGCIDKGDKTSVVINEKEYVVNSIDSMKNLPFDYIIVTTVDVIDIKRVLYANNINEKKVIYFWHEDIAKYPFLSVCPKQLYLLEIKIREYELRIKNAPYEYGVYNGPIIYSADELMKKLIKENKSLCRFGDGEFEIILGRDRSKFQKKNEILAKRLDEVLHNNNSNVIVAIADNYGSLEKYTEEAATDIRNYLTEDVRKQHMQLLDMNRIYYDAYASRAYLMYKDKSHANELFNLYKELFRDRDILIVEGNYTRNGYNNDLFKTAKSIKRILCPDFDCFEVYSEIYDTIIKVADKTDLLLITLGSTATILAYDLACNGYQAIDLGQLDNEYEWYLRKSVSKEAIPGKTVSDVGSDRHLDTIEIDDEYYSQIVREIKSC